MRHRHCCQNPGSGWTPPRSLPSNLTATGRGQPPQHEALPLESVLQKVPANAAPKQGFPPRLSFLGSHSLRAP